jgi:hypothetical protein
VLRRSLVGGVALAMLIAGQVAAQRQRPLSPLPTDGLRVAPFFDGWYENADGTIALSFGYSNLNRTELVEIPLGPDNNIQPKEYDGRQPTSFPPVAPTATGDGSGAPSSVDRRQRERGVFTVTVPAGFKGDVVWTLRYQGQTYSVPGRTRIGAYRLQWPMAMGSMPPLLRFSANGPAGRGPMGIQADPQRVVAGAPLSLTVWTNDDSEREKEPIQVKQRAGERPALNVNWFKHSGPGAVVFTPARTPIAELQGSATTSAVFKQPGEYVIRVRADNFGRLDTSPGNQCCWTNGYVRVTVTP